MIAQKAVQDILKVKWPTQADYAAMLRARRSEILEITTRLANMAITAQDWADAFNLVLYSGHGMSWMMGRQRAGDLTPETIDDLMAGIAAKDRQNEFLNNFLDALIDKDARYFDEEGLLKINSVMNRADLYVGAMRGTANEAWVSTSSDEEEFIWHLGGNEKHCNDCPRIAALSPFTKDTLFTYPCDGDTDCLGRCLCWLERTSDPRTGFKAVSLAA